MGYKILVVEDEIIVARDVEKKLRALGYEVTQLVSSGDAALQSVELTPPDLILMDIFLKGSMDGIQVAELIRERYDIPIIYMTAHSNDTITQRAINTAPFGYIMKPFELQELRVTTTIALIKADSERKQKGIEQELRQVLTDQKALQEQLIQSAKLASIGELSAKLHHELNQPLTVILSYAQLIEETLRKEPDRQTITIPKYVNQIKENVGKAVELVEQLRRFSRPSDKKQELVNVNEVVKAALVIFQGTRGRMDIQVGKKMDTSIPRIHAHYNEIEQVILNLLSNARDALIHTEKPEILIHTHYDSNKSQVGIRIEDNGCGIPETIQSNIFLPFVSTKPREKGTGLGLPISYSIIHNHGGSIHIESTERHGTIVQIWLPCYYEKK
jgi:C4-dicarboxylate-specific signal transduction histidine kinase